MRDELLEILDLTLPVLPVLWDPPEGVPEPLFLARDQRRVRSKDHFWRHVSRRLSFSPLRGAWLPRPVLTGVTDDFHFHDFTLLSDERIDALNNPYSIVRSPSPFPTDWRMMDQLKECTPQYFLRNIPRAERAIDFDDPMPFHRAENVLRAAGEALIEVREAEIPRPEFSPVWSAKALTDFKVFLEETLYLCSWEEIPSFRGRQRAVEGTSWDPKLSNSKVTEFLTERSASGSIFAVGQQGKLVEIQVSSRRKRREVRVIDRNPRRDEDLEGVEVIDGADGDGAGGDGVEVIAGAGDEGGEGVEVIDGASPPAASGAPDRAPDDGVVVIDEHADRDDDDT